MLADILEYMKQGRSSIPANILNAKRKELSAERFGQQVADFYEDVITGAAGENNEGNND
jgi:hypothetical protein